MTNPFCTTFCRAMAVAVAAMALSPLAPAQLTNPSHDELQMTSLPEVPGAPAVYLERESIVDDGNKTVEAHVRIKVLTAEGKKYAEVILPSTPPGTSFTVKELQARTVHADGTVVPFSGEPADKSTPTGTVKVLTLPDVQPGSIVEYHYKLAMPVESPATEWVLQSDLYTRKLHNVWRLSGRDINRRKRGAPAPSAPAVADDSGGGGGRGGRGGRGGGGGDAGPDTPAGESNVEWLTWASYLPKGIEVKQAILPGGIGGVTNAGMRTMELTAQDQMPAPTEEFAPSAESSLYKVVFYYTAYTEAADFWKMQGAEWSRAQEAFMAPDVQITQAVHSLITPSDTEEMKLKKIYAGVMTVVNTDYARPSGGSAARIGSAAQVWQLKSGNSNQIAALFAALARAAGMKAYLMAVPNREHGTFRSDFLSLSQLPDEVAIVNAGGKDQFFDPGSRYCAYGHLAWQHAGIGGLRQMPDGSTSNAVQTPIEPYTASRIQRAANLTLAPDGTVSGRATLVFSGAPALEWRQKSLATDDTGFRSALRSWMQGMVPAGMEVQIPAYDKLADYDQPLTVQFQVSGRLGSASGKRIELPGDFFLAGTEPSLTAEKRTLPIDFHYSWEMIDASRITYPAGYAVASSPAADKNVYLKSSEYTLSSAPGPNNVTVRRDLIMADVVIPAEQYGAFRTYYTQMDQKSRQAIVLNAAGGGN